MNDTSRRSSYILILLIACFFLFFYKIGARDLWNPDEPRYAQVAREMLGTGEWVVPHLNGQVYTEKPPLYFWLIALIRLWRNREHRWLALVAAIVMLIIYLIPHSVLGSELDYSTGEVVTGQ